MTRERLSCLGARKIRIDLCRSYASSRFRLVVFCAPLLDTVSPAITGGILLPRSDKALHNATLFRCWWRFKATGASRVCHFSQCCIRLPAYHRLLIPGMWALSVSEEGKTTVVITLLLVTAVATVCPSFFLSANWPTLFYLGKGLSVSSPLALQTEAVWELCACLQGWVSDPPRRLSVLRLFARPLLAGGDSWEVSEFQYSAHLSPWILVPFLGSAREEQCIGQHGRPLKPLYTCKLWVPEKRA